MSKIPASVSDVLLHEKDTDKTERVILPVTRYKNVLNAPTVATNVNTVKGSPFVLYATDSEMLSSFEIRSLVNGIL